MTLHPPVPPPPLPPSILGYSAPPPLRAAELPGMASVRVQDLFPEIPTPIFQHGGDRAPIRAATRDALVDVDMAMIRPDETVNVLCSEHGFAMMGGEAYAEVLRSIRDEVVERTGCRQVRLALSSAGTKYEGIELIPQFGLDDHFEGQVFNFGPYDRGVPIDTAIGRLYGIRRAYSADRLIHVHYDDPREIYFHRVNGRTLKSFAMSYARIETRTVFHNNFPTRSAAIVPRAIYESDHIQRRWAFATVLMTAPTGAVGVDADNDLMALDRRVSRSMLANFGKMIRLFAAVETCFSIADDTRWLPYQHAGGLTACVLFAGNQDHLDLDEITWNLLPNPAVKALVLNHAWVPGLGNFLPTIAASPAVARRVRSIDQRPVTVARDLPEAMALAREMAGTDKAIVFDGSYGSINLTPALGAELLAKAPEVSRQVDEELLPKWLRQRRLGSLVA